MQRIDYFRRVSLFARLEDDDLAIIARTAISTAYERDEVIVWEKDPADVFFVIEEGSVRVSRMAPDGREITLSHLSKGDFFGEMALLIDEPRTATITAEKATRVLKIYRRDFLLLLERNTGTTLNILRGVCTRLARANALIENLVHIDVCGRLAGYLRKMAETRGEETPKGMIRFRRPTQQEIADTIGCSRETVSRLLKQLKEQGLIRMEGKMLILSKTEVDDA